MTKLVAMAVGAVAALAIYWMCLHIRGIGIDNDTKAFQLERMKVSASRADADYERRERVRLQKEAQDREYIERRIKEIGGAE